MLPTVPVVLEIVVCLTGQFIPTLLPVLPVAESHLSSPNEGLYGHDLLILSDLVVERERSSTKRHRIYRRGVIRVEYDGFD